jgi:hypothetical protein
VESDPEMRISSSWGLSWSIIQDGDEALFPMSGLILFDPNMTCENGEDNYAGKDIISKY